MNKILHREALSADVTLLRVEAPLIARERRAGQFVIVQIDSDFGERIPLTIADADPAEGSITLVFQSIGNSTRRLARLGVGEFIANLLGPLGQPTHIEKFGHVVCVGGGVGTAPMHPITQALRAAGNIITVISGARNSGLLIMQDRMAALADRHVIVTDDGSAGVQGLVVDPLRELCEGREPAGARYPQGSSGEKLPKKPDFVVTIGPGPMMKACADLTRGYAVKTVASLNTIMVDGTGMCGGCRVTVGGKSRFVCVEGPEFDAHEVDFGQLLLRLKSFREKEQADLHACLAEAEGEAKERSRSGGAA